MKNQNDLATDCLVSKGYSTLRVTTFQEVAEYGKNYR